MLISISNRFVFVAMLKAASTAIESKWRAHADIAISLAPFGKHLTVSQIAERFAWLFADVSLSKFFVFAVMRDPVDYMLSLYNSHCNPAFAAEPRLFIGNRSFAEFLDSWAAANADQVRPQHERLLDKEDRVAVDYVISYENLAQGLETVARRVGIGPVGPLAAENKSFGKLRRTDLRRQELEWIQRTYRRDMVFRDRYCDRLLGPSDKIHPWA
jgi:hypothetical protein